MSATIVSPRLMLVGGGCVAEIAGVLAKFGLSRPLVVTDPYMASSGLVRRCLDPLEAAGLAPAVFSDTVPEPTDTVVEAGVALLQAGQYDCLVGFGGGSPIDTAKAMSILAHGRASGAGSAMRDFKVPASVDAPGLPVIAVPTTAGAVSPGRRRYSDPACESVTHSVPSAPIATSLSCSASATSWRASRRPLASS